MAGLIAFDAALALIAGESGPLGSETLPLDRVAGRTLAAPVHARQTAPARAVSAMDGYAVIDAATRPDEPQRVIGEARPGMADPGMIRPGEAMRIFTGGPLPQGADRVIMQEAAQRDGDRVCFTAGYGPGWHVRAPGSDFHAGDVLAQAGTRIDPRGLIAIAAADVAEVAVARIPRVVILGTGDELVPPGQSAEQPGTIPESVTFGIAAMVVEAGGQVIRRGSSADDLPALEQLAGQALADADLVIVTGGASVGERDFGKAMFAPHGLDLRFAKVAIKPGKPVWFGVAQGCRVLGLPGNPTSAMVTAALFLRPLIGALLGRGEAAQPLWRSLPLAAPLKSTGDREEFVRARWEPAGLVPVSNQDSGAQAALARSDWLIRRASGSPAAAPGDLVRALAF